MKIDISEKLWDRQVIIRVLVGILAIIAVFAVCVMVLSPFVPAIMLGLILTLATWPAFRWLEQKLNHRTTLAASIMTLSLVVVFVAPLFLVGSTLIDNFSALLNQMNGTLGQAAPPPPSWLKSIPFINGYAEQMWADYIQNTDKLPILIQEHSGQIYQKILAIGGSIGRGVLDISLAVFISFFMFRHGVSTAARLHALILNFGGARAVHLLDVSKGTLIAVIYGLVGTAIAQGVTAGIGFAMTGIPAPVLLGLIVFILSFIPGGPPMIWIPATIWLFTQDHNVAGIILGLWSLIIVSGTDNILRPYFISLGSDLPLILILMGVVGGILAFGFIGIFVGPTVLAVAYSIMMEWSHKENTDKIVG